MLQIRSRKALHHIGRVGAVMPTALAPKPVSTVDFKKWHKLKKNLDIFQKQKRPPFNCPSQVS
jgi:hypothetical protein